MPAYIIHADLFTFDTYRCNGTMADIEQTLNKSPSLQHAKFVKGPQTDMYPPVPDHIKFWWIYMVAQDGRDVFVGIQLAIEGEPEQIQKELPELQLWLMDLFSPTIEWSN